MVRTHIPAFDTTVKDIACDSWQSNYGDKMVARLGGNETACKHVSTTDSKEFQKSQKEKRLRPVELPQFFAALATSSTVEIPEYNHTLDQAT